MTASASLQIQVWPIERLVFYARNPRKNDAAVDRMWGSIRECGFKTPVLARSDGEVVDGHLQIKAAPKLRIRWGSTRPVGAAEDPPGNGANPSENWAKFTLDKKTGSNVQLARA